MLLNYSVLVLSILLTVTSQLLIKQGVGPLGASTLSLERPLELVMQIARNAYIVGGLAILGLTFVLWVWLTSRMQLNTLYATTVSLQLVFLTLGSWLFFKETISSVQLLGMAAIIIGIFLVLRPS